MELLNPSVEQVVLEIIAVDRAWKEAQLFDRDNNFLANSLQDLKARLQVRLLRSYAPKLVFLRIDGDEYEYDEPVYGLHLTNGHSTKA